MRERDADKDDMRWMRAGEFDRRQEQDGLELIGRYVRVSKRHPFGRGRDLSRAVVPHLRCREPAGARMVQRFAGIRDPAG